MTIFRQSSNAPQRFSSAFRGTRKSIYGLLGVLFVWCLRACVQESLSTDLLQVFRLINDQNLFKTELPGLPPDVAMLYQILLYTGDRLPAETIRSSPLAMQYLNPETGQHELFSFSPLSDLM